MLTQELTVGASANLAKEQGPATCSSCRAKDNGLCGKLTGPSRSYGNLVALPLVQSFATARPREIIYRVNQPREHFSIVCEGWAFRFHRLRDGRRHIVSFLIAGDVVSDYSIFTGSSEFSIQALTEIRYCKFDPAQIRTLLLQDPMLFEDWLERSVNTLTRIGHAAVALGRLDAQERIGWFVLQLYDRLNASGMVNGDTIEFPLRQSHIADATGLTTVHVCRVINAYRKQGIFAIDDGVLRILDLATLRRFSEVM
jgi:CRP/FNR family transcriptional regulator, anaerobic regulatory protein